MIFGKAAKGLAKSNFDKKSKFAGIEGEKKFLQELEKSKITKDYDVWCSLKIPNSKYRTDVDFAITNNKEIILIDVKMWQGGKHYWSLNGIPFKGLSPMKKNGKIGLSKNMQMAVEAYKKHFPEMTVSAKVVFVPTNNKKTPKPASVFFLKWPGNINSIQMNDFIKSIKRKRKTKTNEHTTNKMKKLLK